MNSSFAQRIRVPLGFGYGLLFLYFATPRPGLFSAGILLGGLGLALRVWASGYLKKGRELATSGPYAWSRNPLYLGSFVMGLGFTVAAGSLWLTLLFLTLFVAVYLPVMKREERELAQMFGSDYSVYREAVALFLPLGAPVHRTSRTPHQAPRGNFQWQKVICNREYKAVIGFLLVAALLWAKMVLWR
ncbi:MAG: isoprenylcysteine carboxylmethyltransferase family protein [Acidobacteriota bacterium]